MEIQLTFSEAKGGPLYKQDGTLLLGKGKHLSNTQLMSMNYFVKGVDAAYPK